MYAVNELGRPVLITVSEVVNQAMIDENIDVRYVQNAIVIAEERFIAPVLGRKMYQDMCSQKNVVVTSGNQAGLLADINASRAIYGKDPIQLSAIPVGMLVNAIELVTTANYKELWKWYLWKLTAECVDVMCIVPTWLRHTSQGQQKNNPVVIGGNTEGSATGDRKDVEYKVDSMIQSRINPLIAAMELWICETGGFTLYPCNKCKGHEDGINGNGKGGIITGLYDDIDERRKRDCC